MIKTREETESHIVKLTFALHRCMPNLERSLLMADRHEARVYLSTLPIPHPAAATEAWGSAIKST